MMKRTVFVLLMLCIVCTMQVFAADNFLWSLGITIGKSDFDDSDLDDLGSGLGSGSAFSMIGLGSDGRSGRFAIGGESRIRLFMFDFGAIGEFTIVSKQILYFSGMVNAGFGFDIAKSVGIGLSLGPSVEYLLMTSFARDVMVKSGIEIPTFMDAVRRGCFNYRITLDAIIGPVLRVGLAYTLPTSFTLEVFNPADLVPFRNTDSTGKFSLCLQMAII